MPDTKADSLRMLLKEMELEKIEMQKYIAKSELMASTLRSVIEMYRLTGTKESKVAKTKFERVI
jgi:hypothetical protein